MATITRIHGVFSCNGILPNTSPQRLAAGGALLLGWRPENQHASHFPRNTKTQKPNYWTGLMPFALRQITVRKFAKHRNVVQHGASHLNLRSGVAFASHLPKICLAATVTRNPVMYGLMSRRQSLCDQFSFNLCQWLHKVGTNWSVGWGMVAASPRYPWRTIHSVQYNQSAPW